MVHIFNRTASVYYKQTTQTGLSLLCWVYVALCCGVCTISWLMNDVLISITCVSLFESIYAESFWLLLCCPFNCVYRNWQFISLCSVCFH